VCGVLKIKYHDQILTVYKIVPVTGNAGVRVVWWLFLKVTDVTLPDFRDTLSVLTVPEFEDTL
jgi:hypothetical protein